MKLNTFRISYLCLILLLQYGLAAACKFSSDCPDQCDGNNVLPRDCNLVTNTCETIPSFKKNCSDTSLYKPFEFDVSGKILSVPQKCLLSDTSAYCGNDKVIAMKEWTEECRKVREKYDSYEQDRIYLSKMSYEASLICLDHASDLTANLIVTGAFAIVGAGSAGAFSNGSSFLTIANNLIGETTNQIISRLLPTSALRKSSNELKDLIQILAKGKVKAEDFCTIQKRLNESIIPVVDKIRNQYFKEYESCKTIEKQILVFPDSVKRRIDIDFDPPKKKNPPGNTKKPPKKPTVKPPKTKKPSPNPETKPPLVKDCDDLDKTSKEWLENCYKNTDHPESLPELSFEFTCGNEFELSPNEVLYPKTCDVLVKSTGSTREKVKVVATYNTELLDVTFDNQTKAVEYPVTRFLLIIRTRIPVPVTLTNLNILVQHGSLEVAKNITVSILEPGIEPSSGPGIRPPADVEVGSGGTYCVWRYKSFGDKPKCFNILTAECDNPKYIDKPKYELVGSELTEEEAVLRAFVLSPYKGDFYGCHSTDNPSATGSPGDADNDTVPDEVDNCINTPNQNQQDGDQDQIGDACDDDHDNDGVRNLSDNCPQKPNPDQHDTDSDGKGDACDLNNDSDSFLDADDNCPLFSNPTQDDLDNDGIGDACDDDIDGDGVLNSADNCRVMKNSDQADLDADGVGDVCDVDKDGDGKRNGEDNCPDVANPDQKNSDSHWQGDACQSPAAASGGDLGSTDCSSYPGTQAVWDEATQSAGCSCTGDEYWSDALKRCASHEEDVIANTDCSSFGNAKAIYDQASGEGMCECKTGYEFDANNLCVQVVIDENCSDYPGTVYSNGACQCPGALEWSETQQMCVQDSGLTQADVDCTSYPGSIPQWDIGANSWKCECIGNKQWSAQLNSCVYPEDESVASSDCSSFKGTVAVFDDFTQKVECKCINSGHVLSSTQNSCMSPSAAQVADHDCSSFGTGAISYLNPVTQTAECKCKSGFDMDSTGTGCESNTAITLPQGQGVLPTPEIIKPGQCNVLYDDGSDQPESYVFKVDGFSQIRLNYDTDRIKDNISVLTSSRSELWRSGCVGTGNYKAQVIDIPAGSREVIIDVHPNCDGQSSGTSWKFKAECL